MSDHHEAEEVLAANKVLDEHVAATAADLVTLKALIDDHATIIRNQDRQAARQRVMWYIIGVVAVVATLIGVVGLSIALDVETNAKKIDRTQEAIAVYCAQTNVYNAEAHDKFLALFTRPESQERVREIADVAWPQRNCTVRPGGAVVSVPSSTPGLSAQATSTTSTVTP